MTEKLTIVLLTYQRTEYAVRTIESVTKNLRYPNYQWYVADDGSNPEHFDTVMRLLEHLGAPICGSHSQSISYGAGANRGVRKGWPDGELTMMLEDDWELTELLDVWVYAALLMERPDVGMVRMGYLNSGVGGLTMGHTGTLYWALDDTHSSNYSSFAFAGHPAIIHKRFFDHYGMYPERWQPGETELKMCWQVAGVNGPKVVWPAHFGERGPWGHIGAQQSYEWNGGARLD